MKLTVQRLVLTPQSTCGNLFIDDALECWTLELPKKDGLPGSCIQAGLYSVALNRSQRFSNDPQFLTLCHNINCLPLMPEVLDVPDRDNIIGKDGFRIGIRIHWGNWASDTEGCILVGKSHQNDAIGESRDAFAELYTKMVNAVNNFEAITLEVIDAPEH